MNKKRISTTTTTTTNCVAVYVRVVDLIKLQGRFEIIKKQQGEK